MQSKSHWENVYTTKSEDEVSWFQEHAGMSLKLIEQTGAPKSIQIIDLQLPAPLWPKQVKELLQALAGAFLEPSAPPQS